jgi:hypothetical protein
MEKPIFDCSECKATVTRLVMIPLKKLARICNPLRDPCWGTIVTRYHVRWALETGLIESKPDTENHAARIAFFVKNESEDPIEIDVGVPALMCYVDWPVTDGNHRLAAAIYAKRPFIKASVGGDLNYAKKLFGVDCEQKRLK